VLSGPYPGQAGRLAFWVSIGEDVGRCFISRAEALGLHQLTPGWVQRALVNVVDRLGADEVVGRLRSQDGLEIRADDAVDEASPTWGGPRPS
jgi:hypothetical protein